MTQKDRLELHPRYTLHSAYVELGGAGPGAFLPPAGPPELPLPSLLCSWVQPPLLTLTLLIMVTLQDCKYPRLCYL